MTKEAKRKKKSWGEKEAGSKEGKKQRKKERKKEKETADQGENSRPGKLEELGVNARGRCSAWR